MGKIKIYRFIVVFILLCNIGIVMAQINDEHLEPVGGIFEISDYQFEYYSKIRTLLFNGLTDSPEIRFLVIPSFTPENVLDIDFDRENNKYYLKYNICDKSIWYNKTFDRVSVIKFCTKIDKKSVDLIKSLFGLAITQVRFPPLNENGEVIVKADGTRYYFTSNSKSGVTHSPSEGTKMEKLVNIGIKLIELAKSKKETVKIGEMLQKDIEELIDELK